MDWLPMSESMLTALCFKNRLMMVGEEVGRRRELGVDRPEPFLVLLGESTFKEPSSPRINRSSLSRQASWGQQVSKRKMGSLRCNALALLDADASLWFTPVR